MLNEKIKTNGFFKYNFFPKTWLCNVPKTRQEDIPTHTASVVIKVTNILREDKTHHNHTVGQGNIL